MRIFWKVIVAAAACLGALNSASAQTLPGTGKTIRYVQGDSLGGNYVVNQIVLRALKAMGYDVKISTMNITLFFSAVAQGDVDISFDINMPQRYPAFQAVSSQASTIGSGTIKGNGVNGYLIDKKTAIANNITSLEQMKDPKIAGLFGKNGKASLISCDPGWSCGDVVDYQLEKFGLKDTVKDVRGKYETLMAETVARARNGEPVFFYAWSPSWAVNALVPGKDVVWLPTPMDALPPDVPNRGSALVNGVEGCAGGADPCRMAMAAWNWVPVGNNAFLAANPAVKALIEQIDFPADVWSHWETTISKSGGSSATITRLANEWIAANQVQLDQWIAQAVK